jgi:hypothetical protein
MRLSDEPDVNADSSDRSPPSFAVRANHEWSGICQKLSHVTLLFRRKRDRRRPRSHEGLEFANNEGRRDEGERALREMAPARAASTLDLRVRRRSQTRPPHALNVTQVAGGA